MQSLQEDTSSEDTVTNSASSQICLRTATVEHELNQSSTRQSSRDSDSAIAAGYSEYPIDIEDMSQSRELLELRKLNLWDYPIFDVSDTYPDCILSLVSVAIQFFLPS